MGVVISQSDSFNSRSRVGSDVKAGIKELSISCFNSRSRVGSDSGKT